MKTGHLASILAASATPVLALVAASAPSASAAPSAASGACPNAEVVFARGTNDLPGLGDVGQAFVNSLPSKAGGKSVGVYPVNYPAGKDFSTGLGGINDAGTHVEQMAVRPYPTAHRRAHLSRCPPTSQTTSPRSPCSGHRQISS